MPNEIEEKAVLMSIFIKPSVQERLKNESRKEARAVSRHAGIVIERYLDEKGIEVKNAE